MDATARPRGRGPSASAHGHAGAPARGHPARRPGRRMVVDCRVAPCSRVTENLAPPVGGARGAREQLVRRNWRWLARSLPAPDLCDPRSPAHPAPVAPDKNVDPRPDPNGPRWDPPLAGGAGPTSARLG